MIFCKIPNAGLGNQLFLIAQVLIFAKKNAQKIIFLNFHQFKIGPYIRGERTKREYKHFFVFQSGLLVMMYNEIRFLLMSKSTYLIDPEMEVDVNFQNTVFIEIPHYSDYFRKIRPYRELVKEELLKIITHTNKQLINELKPIDVAVHVRLGDFKKLQTYVSFANVGSTRTPIEYYINSITHVKDRYPSYNFFIFTDGYRHEISELLELDGVEYFDSINDLVDLYQMSKSKILITSAGSTYSYWAGFLGDCEIIQHPDHFQKII